jgi:beta-lactam-binding protein with PASTA domain
VREVDIERTAYPRLLESIKDGEVVFRYTFSPEELSLVKNYKGNKLSLAVRLKVFGHLLSHNFTLSDFHKKW